MEQPRTSSAWPTALAVLALSLVANLRAQQVRPPDAGRPQSTSAGPVRVSGGAGLHMVAGELWGGADSYKVRFDADGFEFTPALGRAAPRNYPLTFRLESIGRGSVVAPMALRAPTYSNLRVEYDRGVAAERYDIGADGIEQSFVFATRPEGTGDLVVRARLTTDLQVTPEGEGLRFSLPGIGSFRMSGVVGIDARGDRVPGTVHYADGVLELALPAAFVASAALPLTLDPPIGALIRVTPAGGFDDQFPLAAYDASTDLYLVIWTRIVSATDIDVLGQRVDRAGALVGFPLFIEISSAFEYEPEVTGCGARDAFVVVYTRNGDVIGRTVRAADGAVSNAAVIAGGGSFQHFAAVSSAIDTDHAVCVWQSDGDVALQTTRVTASPALTLTTGTVHTFAAGTNPRAINPRISKSDGGRGRHAVAYQREFVGGANSDPYLIVVDGSGAPLTSEHLIDSSARDDESVAVDGDGDTWMVAWHRSMSAVDHDVHARSASFDARAPGLLVDNGPSVPVANASVRDEVGPSVMWIRDSCLIGFTQQTSSGWTATVASVDPFLCTKCENEFFIRWPHSVNGPVYGCTVTSGGSSSEDALLVWESQDPAFNGDVVAIRWRAVDGVAASFGPGCGEGGTNRATCGVSLTISNNPSFALRLRDALPGAPTLLVLSASRLGLSCGACTLVPDPIAGVLVPTTTDASGDCALPVLIRPASTLVGVPLLTQWATLDLASPACPSFSVDFSNALQVVIERN